MIYVGSFWWCCCDLRSRRSIYHGNILIKEQCRLPVLACWINICAQMYSAASMYMLSSQFSFHLNGRRLSYRHMWHVWAWFTYSSPSSLFPPLLLSFIPWFFWGGGFPLSASSQQRCKRDVIKFGLPWVPSLPHVYLMHASQLYTSVFSLPVIDCFPDRP